MPRILISDELSPNATKVFERRGVEVDRLPGLTSEQLALRIADYDGLAIRSATKVTEQIILGARNLKVIGRAGIGVDNVDLDVATAAGIVVMNTPFGNAITTAEHAISMICSLAREITTADTSTQSGKWEKSRFMGTELTGKNLGIIGCGNIGSIVADRGQGLRMRVLAFDPYLSEERAQELGVRKVDAETLFRESDFITLHTPLTDTTRDIINSESISKMKTGVRIVNCARGGLIVESDLKDALESGHVSGAALDVFKHDGARAFARPPVYSKTSADAYTHARAQT